MGVGRRVARRARSGGSCGSWFRRGLQAAAVAAVVVCAVSAGRSPVGEGEAPTRLVLSSQARETTALTVGTKSLYAKNDRWRAYLASESVCPGGERTDLPAARQVATVACLVNFARKVRGLHALPIARVLTGASNAKASQIVRCATFAHDPCGAGWAATLRATGYRGVVGENLYLANGRWAAPRVAVDAWLNSEAHRRNLFDRDWSEQGIAMLSRTTFGEYQGVSVWVNVLGNREPG